MNSNTNKYLLKLTDDSHRLRSIVEHNTGLMLTNIALEKDPKLPWSRILVVSAVNTTTNKKSTLYFDEFALFNMVTEGEKIPHCQGEVMDSRTAETIQKTFIKNMIESNNPEYYFSLMKYLNTLASLYKEEEQKHTKLHEEYKTMQGIAEHKRQAHLEEEFTLACNNAHYLENELHLIDFARASYTKKLQDQKYLQGERQ